MLKKCRSALYTSPTVGGLDGTGVIIPGTTGACGKAIAIVVKSKFQNASHTCRPPFEHTRRGRTGSALAIGNESRKRRLPSWALSAAANAVAIGASAPPPATH